MRGQIDNSNRSPATGDERVQHDCATLMNFSHVSLCSPPVSNSRRFPRHTARGANGISCEPQLPPMHFNSLIWVIPGDYPELQVAVCFATTHPLDHIGLFSRYSPFNLHNSGPHTKSPVGTNWIRVISDRWSDVVHPTASEDLRHLKPAISRIQDVRYPSSQYSAY